MNTEEKLTLDELAAIWIDGLTPCCTNNALNKLRLAGDITEYVNQELKQRDETIKQLKEALNKADEMRDALNKLLTGLAKDGVALDGFVDAWRVNHEYVKLRLDNQLSKLITE